MNSKDTQESGNVWVLYDHCPYFAIVQSRETDCGVGLSAKIRFKNETKNLNAHLGLLRPAVFSY